jgi:hypothetical protein
VKASMGRDIIQRWLFVTMLVASTTILLGCGLKLQTAGPATGSADSPSSQGAAPGNSTDPPQSSSQLPTVPLPTTPIVMQPTPTPSSLQALTGCTNPNTGVSNNDWGVGSDPVYTTVNNVEPIVATAEYTSNTIFWISRETAPGQSVLMTGAFTDTPKTVRVALIPPGTVNWQTLVQASATVVPATQQGTTGLSFIVPTAFPPGIYGFQIEDASASPTFAMANVPRINWVIGIPSLTDPTIALQHQVYDCGAEPGEILRIFGKNFTQGIRVILQASSGAVYSLTPSQVDTNSIAVAIPSALSAGTYNLWVGSSPWSITSSQVSQITVYSAPNLSVTYATCPSLVGNGTTDNTAQLQQCLDSNAPSAGSNQLVYITIPSGTFVLSGGVKPHPYEVLEGTSPTATNFVGRPNGLAAGVWLTIPQHFAMANLSFEAPANPAIASTMIDTGSPLTSGHVFFDNVNFQSTSDESGGNEFMFSLTGPDIQVYDSVFLSGSNYAFSVGWADGAVISGNQIILNDATALGFSDSQNLIMENNSVYSQNTPGQGPNGIAGGAGLGISRANNQFGPSALSQDIYVGYNTFKNMGATNQQIITIDGDGGAYYGPIASSTAQAVVLADDPAWNWMGTTNPQAASIAIVTGTGMGQYSLISSYSGKTINLVTPWKVLPDSTSVVVISQYELNITIAHNTLTNTLGTSIVLFDALEAVVEDNTLTNSGGGILIAGFGPYGGPASYGPTINTDVLRNTMAVGAGNFITPSANTNVAGIGISDFPGCLISGLLIRDNTVPPIQSIFSTDGLNLVSAALIEQNDANWVPTWNISGFLIQDNSQQ